MLAAGARSIATFGGAFALTLSLGACTPKGNDATSGGATLDAPPWDASSNEPEPRPGMAWIPPGVLLAGTPPDRLPRVADEEMAGEQVVMRGFYMDLYPYPNEAGAIPTTNLSQHEARELCVAQGKRLCTELEMERACKGPDNTTYEYGDAYKPSVCVTGVARNLVPNGVNTACQSAFGVHDLHGGVWQWTSSQWNRDATKKGLVTVRGGNGAPGDLLARCANGRGVRADAQREDVGARCCAGEPNVFEVVLNVVRGEPLKWQPPDDKLAPQLEKLVPKEIVEATRDKKPEDRFKVERVWLWHPLGNEELVVGGGCAHPLGVQHQLATDEKLCGVVIARVRYETPLALAFVPSEWWQPTLHEAETAREIYLHGGDRNGAFRRRISYAWGRIAIGEKERKKRARGEKEPHY